MRRANLTRSLTRALTLPCALAALTACGQMDGMDDSGAYYPPSSGASNYAPPASDRAPDTEAPDESREQYEHYGHNPFVDAEADNLATFAVDVDTASYTIARRTLNSGYLPDPAAVRTEEFINYFRYDDAGPAIAEARPFAVHMEAAPSPFGDSAGGRDPDGVRRALLRVGIKGLEIAPEERKAANLIFLVDVSGSMAAPNKLGLVQYSLRQLTRSLRPDDTIGIVVYAGADGVALSPTPVSEAGVIFDAVESMRAGGGTNGEAGIRAAYRLAESAYRPGGINRVIICTDGDFNVGLTGDALVDLIEEKREEGVTLTALGFGAGNYNDRTMEQLADKGNGNYGYIDQQSEADRLLVHGLTGTLQVIAKDAKVQVEVNPDLVSRYRLIGYENRDIADEDFRDDAVDAGEIGAGHQVTAYLELELRAGEDLSGPLASASVRYKAPEATAADAALEEVRVTLSAEAMRPRFEDASGDFQIGAAIVEFAEILRESPHSVGARFGEVKAIVDRHAGEDAARLELSHLISVAQGLMD